MATKSETAVAKTIRLKKEAKAKLQRQSVKVDKTEQARRAALRKKQVAKAAAAKAKRGGKTNPITKKGYKK
tara:strand:+ start:548 stop:760 length:213 start_codon:yes stop_codon:yes gene_type:complete